ncbi:RimK family alpha-L-glutamate ligase [Flavobacterium sp. H122]|uniref:ATP-grasp domain-containing protein n=1 Tax=Flavobacterium sp. H122 TaxID=2529860 RepID=UPI0010AAF10E|nr:ATP-grasp ribosomal peptide maturase [Flavobacterium sp. H122]
MVLCITHSNDFYTVDIVINRLKESGIKVLRFNSDDFSYKINFEYHKHSENQVLKLITPDFEITSDEIQAVWYRKLWNVAVPENLEDDYKKIYNQEYLTMRSIFFDSLKNVPWINPIDIDHKISDNKFEQLKLASQSGLSVPKSLFTNNSQSVKDFFYTECNQQMIAKLHGALSRSMSGNTPFFPTTIIQEADLENLDSLIYCPMIFQEKIEKQYELRVIYVDGEFFTGKINAADSVAGSTDWRAAVDTRPSWENYDLPLVVCESIKTMMKKMNLFFWCFGYNPQKKTDTIYF